MSTQGVEVRVLPDGGRMFDVVEPDLSWIRVDHQTRLQFGAAELVIECPFVLQTGITIYHLDPNDRGGLGPLFAVYPDTLAQVTMAPDGRLEVAFASGAVLTVSPDPQFEAWSIGGFWCPPGGTASR